MQEQLITFETAKLAKEKGFNVSCVLRYASNSKLCDSIFDFDDWCEAPTQSLLQKWLREKHFIFIDIKTLGNHVFLLAVGKLGEINSLGNNYRSYEEALEKGLQEALKLIQL